MRGKEGGQYGKQNLERDKLEEGREGWREGDMESRRNGVRKGGKEEEGEEGSRKEEQRYYSHQLIQTFQRL